jgi:predicted GNAT family acetyltransferase
VKVADNAAEHRFELTEEGNLALLVYRLQDENLILEHTFVPDAARGRGLGGMLVSAAVERAIARDLTVVPQCPFVLAWLRKHPDRAARARIDWPAE